MRSAASRVAFRRVDPASITSTAAVTSERISAASVAMVMGGPWNSTQSAPSLTLGEQLVGLGRGQDLGRAFGGLAGGEEPDLTLDVHPLRRIEQRRVTGEDRRQARARSGGEHPVQRRLAQVELSDDDTLAEAGSTSRPVRRRRAPQPCRHRVS